MEQTPKLTKEQREQKYLDYRIKRLPEQLDRAYRRVEMLEREAVRLGMTDLLKGAGQ